MKLEGVRVVDLSQFLPGPHLSQVLADNGADVIKVEPPGGDPGRHIGLAERGHTVFFRNLNRGKRSVCLDLKRPAAREALLRLVDGADVFLEAFRPGVAARLGFDYPTLAARNPRLVYCSLTAFGQGGPYRDRPAHDLTCEAYAGIVSVNLGNDDEPAMPPVPVADFAAASMGLAGVLMALYRREKTGRGDRIDVSMHDAALAWLPNALGTVFAEKRPPVPKHERTWGGGAFYRIYRTKDGRHVVLGGQEPKFVRNLLEAWGRPDLVEPCERGPGPHQQAVVDFLQQTFLTRTRDEWAEWFRGRDICFAPVKDLREAFDDEHARARDMRLVDPLGQEHVGLPIKYDAEPGRPDFALAAVGAHTVEVLRELGYDDAAIAAVSGDGAR